MKFYTHKSINEHVCFLKTNTTYSILKFKVLHPYVVDRAWIANNWTIVCL